MQLHQDPPLPSSNEISSSRKLAKAKIYPAATAKATPIPNKLPGHALSAKDSEKVKLEMEKIDAILLDDINGPDWAAKQDEHMVLSQKRQLDVDKIEESKRKVSKRR